MNIGTKIQELKRNCNRLGVVLERYKVVDLPTWGMGLYLANGGLAAFCVSLVASERYGSRVELQIYVTLVEASLTFGTTFLALAFERGVVQNDTLKFLWLSVFAMFTILTADTFETASELFQILSADAIENSEMDAPTAEGFTQP